MPELLWVLSRQRRRDAALDSKAAGCFLPSPYLPNLRRDAHRHRPVLRPFRLSDRAQQQANIGQDQTGQGGQGASSGSSSQLCGGHVFHASKFNLIPTAPSDDRFLRRNLQDPPTQW
jgi:hypothetical protein